MASQDYGLMPGVPGCVRRWLVDITSSVLGLVVGLTGFGMRRIRMTHPTLVMRLGICYLGLGSIAGLPEVLVIVTLLLPLLSWILVYGKFATGVRVDGVEGC
jgi:hypothetical protein